MTSFFIYNNLIYSILESKVQGMVGNLKLAIFMVGLILSFAVAVYALVKVRRYQGVMKLIIIGVLTSFMVTILRSVTVTLLAATVPFVFKQTNIFLNLILLFGLDAVALFIVMGVLKSRIVKQQLNKTASLAITLGYLLNVTLANLLMYANNFAGSFAYNEGTLLELLGEEGAKTFEALVVTPDVFYHLALMLFTLIIWVLFTKVFSMDYQDKTQRIQMFLLLGFYSIMSVLLSLQVLPSVVMFVVSVVAFILLLRNVKNLSWT